MSKPKEKTYLLLDIGQLVHLSEEQLQKYTPYFGLLFDCVGLVITTNQGNKVCYHKYRGDNAYSLDVELPKSDIKADDIAEIETFGGSLLSQFYPRTGTKVTKYTDKSEDLGKFSKSQIITHNSQETLESYVDSPDFHSEAYRSAPKSQEEVRVLTAEESKVHEEKIKKQLQEGITVKYDGYEYDEDDLEQERGRCVQFQFTALLI